jgi:hypothetical protein
MREALTTNEHFLKAGFSPLLVQSRLRRQDRFRVTRYPALRRTCCRSQTRAPHRFRLRRSRQAEGASPLRGPADCNSAVPQIENLRYKPDRLYRGSPSRQKRSQVAALHTQRASEKSSQIAQTFMQTPARNREGWDRCCHTRHGKV